MSNPPTPFAQTVFGLADELDAAELRIRSAVRDAVRAGDLARAIDILDRWENVPVSDVLAAPTSADTPPEAPDSALQHADPLR